MTTVGQGKNRPLPQSGAKTSTRGQRVTGESTFIIKGNHTVSQLIN